LATLALAVLEISLGP